MSEESVCKYQEITMIARDGATAWTCSACGETWFLPNGTTPQENNMNYCPNCGRKIGKYIPLRIDTEENVE